MAVDDSEWDGNAAMVACGKADNPAAAFRAVCAGRRDGPPDQRSSWALPHHRGPGMAPNADGVRNSLSRLPQTKGLVNRRAAQRPLDAHMTTIQAAEGGRSGDEMTELETRVAADVWPTMDFEIRAGDGMGFSGYADVFNSPSEPLPWTERIRPGAFAESL